MHCNGCECIVLCLVMPSALENMLAMCRKQFLYQRQKQEWRVINIEFILYITIPWLLYSNNNTPKTMRYLIQTNHLFCQ